MLENFFDEEELFDSTPISKEDNCAKNLEIPLEPKNKTNFVGFFNQGATCYLNSSLQVLYNTPLFKKLIYDLPLCLNDLSEINNDFIKMGNKYLILINIQKLFIKLNFYNVKSLYTKELTDSFNWNENEGRDQQDSQEFFRLLLFDILDRILKNTQFNETIENMYKIDFYSFMQCMSCDNLNKKMESDYVLPIQVIGFKNLTDSLFNNFGRKEKISDYFCENCKQKVQLQKYQKILKLPEYLIFGLNRFSFDYNTFERIKVNSKFDFPLEINMKNYCIDENEEEDKKNENYDYELYAIIIHSGTPYSGHYFAYIRDLTGQGNWELIKEEKKKEEKKEEEKNEEKKEDEKKEEENKEEENIKEEKKEEEKNENEENKEEENKEEENKYEGKNKKKNKKNKRKQNKKNQNNKNQNNKNNKNNKKENNKKKEQPEEPYSKFDNLDFPIPYSNQDLSKNWFEFNDTSISSIPVGRLQKLFKGKSSAYMLFYIKKNSNTKISYSIPNYLQNYVDDLNHEIEEKRKIYNEEKNSFVINIYDYSSNIIKEEDFIFKIKDKNSFVEKKVKFDNNLNVLINNEKIIYLFELDEKNLFINIKNKIVFNDKNLKENDFYHNCKIFIVDNNFNEKFVINNEIRILHFLYEKNNFDLNVFENDYLNDIKLKLKNKLNLNNLNFNIYFEGNKNKKIYIENNKTVKDLHLQKKKNLFIDFNTELNNNNEQNNIEINNNNKNKENLFKIISTYEEETKMLEINKNSTYNDLYDLIKKDYNFNENFRIFINKKIISKDQFNNQIKINNVDNDNEINITIEKGEIYNQNEILLNILYLKNKEINQMGFILDPNKTTLNTLKKEFKDILTENNNEFNENDYKFFTVDAFNEPNKKIKTETIPLINLKLNDHETLYLKYVKDIPEELAYVNIFKSKFSENYYDLLDHFEEININEENNKNNLNYILNKDDSIKSIKDKITNNNDNINIRLRVIGKFNQLERILKNDTLTIKDYNLENPINLFYEELTDNNLLTKNDEILLIFQKVENKTFTNKKIINIKTTDLNIEFLYNLVKEKYNIENKFYLSKYIRGLYNFEVLYKSDNKNIHLKKILKDSDWIIILESEKEKISNEDFFTLKDEENKKIKNIKKKENKTKKQIYEKPLRINLDD